MHFLDHLITNLLYFFLEIKFLRFTAFQLFLQNHHMTPVW